jgi:biotin synthase-like enzyme
MCKNKKTFLRVNKFERMDQVLNFVSMARFVEPTAPIRFANGYRWTVKWLTFIFLFTVRMLIFAKNFSSFFFLKHFQNIKKLCQKR